MPGSSLNFVAKKPPLTHATSGVAFGATKLNVHEIQGSNKLAEPWQGLEVGNRLTLLECLLPLQ